MRTIGLLLFVFAGLALGQRPAMLTPLQAEQKEVALRSNPTDMKTRAALLEFYFRGPGAPSVNILGRRTHILWLIQNAPADPLAGGPSATIDASGHKLADAEGFKLASNAWRDQIAKQPQNAAVLANAAYFFKLSDMALTLQLLERAVSLRPDDKETASRLGDQYAAAILGVTMVNGNGYPLGADVKLAQGPTAQKARASIETSKNPYVLAKTAYTTTFQSSILLGMKLLAYDYSQLADQWADRAVALAPADREVAAMRDGQRELRRMVTAAQRR
jgi:hypothetical protein